MKTKLIQSLLCFSTFTGTQASARAFSLSEIDGVALWRDGSGVKDQQANMININGSERTVPAGAVNGTWKTSFTVDGVSLEQILQVRMPNACAPSIVVHSVGASAPFHFNIGMSIGLAEEAIKLVFPFNIKERAYLGVFEGRGNKLTGTVKDLGSHTVFDATASRTSETSKLASRSGQATFDMHPLAQEPLLVRDPLQGFLDIASVQDKDEPVSGIVCYGIHTGAKERFFYGGTRLDLTANEQTVSILVQFWDFARSKAFGRPRILVKKFDAPLRFAGSTDSGSVFFQFSDEEEK